MRTKTVMLQKQTEKQDKVERKRKGGQEQKQRSIAQAP
jgi:hypothetical protein